jgi:uncharacterized protein YehS (DUF1456 family)
LKYGAVPVCSRLLILMPSEEMNSRFTNLSVVKYGQMRVTTPGREENGKKTMTNNDILKKLRIALKLKDTDIIEILKLAGFEITKAEVSALFRNPDHRNYKVCGDQILRNFLNGLIIRNRGERP